MNDRPRFSVDAGSLGAGLCLCGAGLLFTRPLLAVAIGGEMMAAAFWIWSRADGAASEQLRRWAWLRRPATALWLAFAIRMVSAGTPGLGATAAPWAAPGWAPTAGGSAPAALALLLAAAIVWAGLELVAALPLARPYSDFPGPYLAARPWLPVVLPAAGFALLWRQAPLWIGVAPVPAVALALLLFTGLVAALRAFARSAGTASLRWLAIVNTALAAALLATGRVPREAVFLLWLAAFGVPAFVLAGELSGAAPRRGAVNARLWRAAGWISCSCLAWPTLLAVADATSGLTLLAALAAAAIAFVLATWVMLGRLETVPERRRSARPGTDVITSRVASTLLACLGPIGLTIAWWSGFEPHWTRSLAALAPPALGALFALATKDQHLPWLREAVEGAVGVARPLASGAYRAVVRAESGVLRALAAAGRGLAAPMRDLHTGDAQEYLLFLIGVAALAVLLPVLR